MCHILCKTNCCTSNSLPQNTSGYVIARSDFSFKSSHSLSIVILLKNRLIFVNFRSAVLTKVGQICCLLTTMLSVNSRFKARDIKYSASYDFIQMA